jgi:DNA-binding CsgD family transcriptional regulator
VRTDTEGDSADLRPGDGATDRAAVRQVSPALVARDGELARLLATVATAPAVVAVAGEAGVGKTRLVAELLARAELAGRSLLVGSCHQIRESFPLGPVVEAVRDAGDRLRGLALSEVAGAVRPLLPELASFLPAAPGPLDDPVAERHRVFRGLTEVLTALAPAVLVLEDLHWADEQTVDFVAYLLTTPMPELAVVLTYRSEEVSAAVRALTARLPAATARAHVALAPLDERETGDLVAAILGAPRVSGEFAKYLWDRTMGLPFAVEEVIALMQTRGLVVSRDGEWTRKPLGELEVPRGIRDSTLARMARLAPGAQRIAEVAAVMQTRVAVPMLLAMTGVTGAAESAAIDAMDEAIGSGLLVEQGETVGFRHVLAAQAVYEDIFWPRRRTLHGRAAAALRTQSPVPLGQVAHHLRCAGVLDEWATTAEAAADHAVALAHDAEAARLLSDVLRNATLDPAHRARVAVKLGRAATQTLHADQVADLLSAALDQDPPVTVRGELRLLLANALNHNADDPGRQRRLFAGAVADLGDRPALRAWAMVGLSLPTVQGIPLAEDRRVLTEAVELVAGIDDPLAEVFVLGKAGAFLAQFGDPAWRGLADRVLAVTGGAPQQRREANAHYSLGVEACYAGQLGMAERLLTSGLRAAATRENRRLEIMMRSGVALHSFCRGEWEGLSEEVDTLLALQAHHARTRFDVDIVAAGLALSRGAVDDARTRLADLIGLAERLGSFQVLPFAGDAAVRAALFRDETAEAVAFVRRCLAPLAAKGLWAPVGRLLPSAAEALTAAGERAELTELLTRVERETRALDAPLASAGLRYARGVLASDAEDLLAAAGEYEAALAPYEAARANERAAAVLLARVSPGDERAPAVLRDAVATYERLGATWDHTRATGLARRHGIALPARHRGGRRGYGTELSPREREVAELAATGRTNKEIAKELFVSAKTVEKHLIAAMRKLGLRSRFELAYRLEPVGKDGGIPHR